MEKWRPVVGFEGLYEVSDQGNVRSINWRNNRVSKNLYLKRHNRGYLQVELTDGSKKKMMLVHRIVAQAFVPNPQELPFINHIDENKQNNRVENLEWCTQSQNMLAYKQKHPDAEFGCRRACKKVKNELRNKFKILQTHLDGSVVRLWDYAIDANRALNYNTTSIWECCEGRRKTAYGYKWQYAFENKNEAEKPL